MSILPAISNDDDVDRLREDTNTCRNAIAAVAEREGLPTSDVHFFSDGSALVGSAGRSVIKMFGHFDRELRDTECRVLEHIGGQLSCPTPMLEKTGEFENWPYLVMSKLDGVPLSTVWDSLPHSERQRLCAAIGRCTAELHALPTDPVAEIPPEWHGFQAEQRTTARDRQLRHPIDEAWLDQVDSYLAGVDLPQRDLVLLHTELMRAHFLVEQRNGQYELSGLVDFEPSMVGQPEYDFSSVGLFVTSGEAGLLGPLLREYGYSDAQLDEAFQQRALAYTLLHRYSCLAWYFRFMPMEEVTTFEQLAKRWWCF